MLENPDLCIIPEKPVQHSVAVPIRTLVETNCSVHFISNTEAITVEIENDTKSWIVKPVRPNRLHLTPNLSEKPGFSVDAVKVSFVAQGKYTVMYDRGRDWESWEPNVQNF